MTAEQQGSETSTRKHSKDDLSSSGEQQGSDESGEGLRAREGVLRYAEERYAERLALGERGASDLPDLNPAWCLLPERPVVLCRTCMRPLTWETRTEPGYLPREGWYDDARTDPLICFKAADYRHIPLTDREWAYYWAGAESASAAVEAPRTTDLAAVLAEHSGCVANGQDNSGSGSTGVDVWSCGIRVPFVDDLDTMEREHLAAALRASLDAELPVDVRVPVPEQRVWVSVGGDSAAGPPEASDDAVSTTSTVVRTVRCGRIDDHPPHHWIRPSLFGKRAARYWCAGPGVIEGGSR